MRRPVVVLTLAFGALAAAYGALVLLDLLARHEVRTTQALALTAERGLDLDTGSGDVTVEPGTGSPRLEAVSQQGLFGGSEVRLERAADGRVSVRATCAFPSSLLSCGTALRVIVPAGTAVRLDTASGDVLVRGLRNGVVAQTGSGDLELVDVGGPEVRADTGSGDIAGRGVATERLQAKTGSGDVDLSATRAPDDTSVDTGSGDAELTVPDELYDVSAETGSGDSQVTVRTGPGAQRRLRVRTGSGDLTVRPAR